MMTSTEISQPVKVGSDTDNSDKRSRFEARDHVRGFEDECDASLEEDNKMKRNLSRKLDWRLCTIAGILCSLNLLDSGIISSASVTS